MEQINLNIIPDGAMPVCHASQFDKNRTIRFNLNQNGSVYTLAGTETITCKVRKPDDTESTINVANTSSSYVDVTFGFSDTDLSGYAMCELKIVNGAQTIGSRNFLLRIEADAYDGSVFEERSASGEIASFETNFIDNLTECIVGIDAVQAGSGTPSPDNVRVILGFSQANIGNISDATNFTYFKGVIEGTHGFVDLGTLTFGSSTNNRFIASVDNLYPSPDNNTLPRAIISSNKYLPKTGNNYVSADYSFYIQTNGTLAIRDIDYSSPTDFANSLDGVYLIYELASVTTPTITPEQFSSLCNVFGITGNLYTIPLGQTVYGGSLNVKTGELTITHGFITLDGSFDYTPNGATTNTSRFIINISGKAYGRDNFISDKFATAMIGDFVGDAVGRTSNSSIEFYLPTTVAQTAVAGKQWFTDNPAQLCYELETPTTATLTPTEVRTLLGNNNIFADTGDIEVKYLIEVV